MAASAAHGSEPAWRTSPRREPRSASDDASAEFHNGPTRAEQPNVPTDVPRAGRWSDAASKTTELEQHATTGSATAYGRLQPAEHDGATAWAWSGCGYAV